VEWPMTRRIFHILFCVAKRLMASARGWRASERANVTAGGCLRNPLSCYTAPPLPAAALHRRSNKERRALPRHRTESLRR